MTGSGNRLTKLTLALVLGLVAVFTAVDFAEARRAGGGGFGSRGMRTYSTPAPTRTAPNNAAPIERSMTPNTGATQTTRPAAAGAQNAAQRSGGLFGNFGRSMLGGLLVGGLIGMLLGNGLGGLAGMFGLILQVAVIALIAMFVMRMFANRRQTAAAGAGHAGAQPFGASQPFGSAKSASGQGSFSGRNHPSIRLRPNRLRLPSWRMSRWMSDRKIWIVLSRCLWISRGAMAVRIMRRCASSPRRKPCLIWRKNLAKSHPAASAMK
ncbi:import inner membrane translocase subunit Tim44 [Brucella abortus bv. 6 str. 870]|nr:import inner membrane translocase subunit Tim44 [Brucella abortus bv. 6 str. 870]EEX80612.1 import inner membrane translocase subunit Tim44 [Brucella abortus bv. 9 str. C68]EEX82727.1 import inner membrane translocase subunit Tim44 [Brucella abortus bv. 3 str. Tulya]